MVKRVCLRAIVFFLIIAGALYGKQDAFEIRVDTSRAPELAEFAGPVKALCEEWYPRINLILNGPGRPLPHEQVRVVIDPAPGRSSTKGKVTRTVVATTNGNVIRLPSKGLKEWNAEYQTLVIHELTHVVQDYTLRLRCDGLRAVPCFFQIRFSQPNPGLGWLSEGIADFVAFAHFSKNIEPRLRLNKNGYLSGYSRSVPYLYGLQQTRTRLDRRGYEQGYAVTAVFLFWLQEKKDKDIVRKLNSSLYEMRGSRRMFQRYCGSSLDDLWRDFLAESVQ